jgi:hypothetical protein
VLVKLMRDSAGNAQSWILRANGTKLGAVQLRSNQQVHTTQAHGYVDPYKTHLTSLYPHCWFSTHNPRQENQATLR